ncbi:uncharacterized protein LOC141587303 [Silene latifolia]|uniref:uncharacterized protein LOC141587303 n=1 Tax=Silene latifolia TaxID=37657 RepID=UPI003D77DDAC
MESSKNHTASSNLWNISEFNYLPPEVWTQILLSLPAKTLLKFRCVCKSWCSIIDDPDFIHMHFQLCKFNSGNNQLLVALERLWGLRDKGWLLTVREAETLENTGLILRKSDSYSFHIAIEVQHTGLQIMITLDETIDRHEPSHLGSFDFDKENIDFLELPFTLDETRFDRFLYLLGGSLAVFSISKVTSNIWVLEQETEKGPWTLWFSGKSTPDAYQLFLSLSKGVLL